MLGRMGFKRKMGRAVPVLALLTFAGVAEAAAEREPLVVKSLPDPELHLVAQSSNVSVESSDLDPAMQAFANAISQAATAEQQSIAARCQSFGPVPARGAVRAAWEFNCRYQRR
jgi:hypothetical protein